MFCLFLMYDLYYGKLGSVNMQCLPHTDLLIMEYESPHSPDFRYADDQMPPSDHLSDDFWFLWRVVLMSIQRLTWIGRNRSLLYCSEKWIELHPA